MPTGVSPNVDPWLARNSSGVVSPSRAGISVQVLRRNPATGAYQYLTNVRCEWIENRGGIDPGSAGFRYVFNNADSQAPQNVQQALDNTYTTTMFPKLVVQGNRILVVAARPDGTSVYLFDGFAYNFSMDLGGTREKVDFVCVGLARRLFDSVLPGAYIRDSSKPTSTDVADMVQTDIIARFNPRIRTKSYANASVATFDLTQGAFHYPVFMDPLLPAGTANSPRFWTLAMAANHLVYRNNYAEDYVRNPTQGSLDTLLVSREPIDGMTFDPGNPATYTAVDITCPDTILTGRDWPLTLFHLIRDKGFGMNFQLVTASGIPQTNLNIYLNQLGSIKPIYLQLQGSTLDPLYSNTASAQMNRQCTDVVNQWSVNGARKKYECSFILAPMFPMQASDGNPGNLGNYDKNSPNFSSTNFYNYRLYGIDEIGEGHYALGTNTKLTTLPDLSSVLGMNYAKIRRPAKGADLVSLDPRGNPLRWSLHYSTNYTGAVGLWDGTGTWMPIESTKRLAEDRLGVYCTATNPDSWTAGRDPTTGGTVVLRGVESQATYTAGKSFTLRLTCCIEGDASVGYTATRRGTSPLQFNITRNIDRRDVWVYEAIAPKSLNNTTTSLVVSRDDTPLAQAEAIQARSASESGIMEGEVVIPYLTDYYQVGDRINALAGRGLGFRSDGITTAAVPVYPVIESRRWEFTENSQKTILRLSDEAVDRYQLERKIRR